MKYALSHALRPRLLFVAGLVFAGFLGWAAADRAAQNQDPPPKRAEEEDKPPAQRREEEEEPGAVTPPKRKIRFEEEDTATKPSHPGINAGADLGQLARTAKSQDVKDLYEKLAVPFDSICPVKLASGERWTANHIRIVPLETLYYTGKGPNSKGPAEYIPLDTKNNRLKPTHLNPDLGYYWIKPYELVALDELDNFRKNRKKVDYEELLVEEQVLSAVLRFHGSAKERGQRKGDWSEVENQLRKRLMTVLLDQLAALTAAADYESAFPLASHLADSFPAESDQLVIAPRIVDLLEKALQAKEGPSLNPNQLRDVHRRLRTLAAQFPNNPKMQELRERLRERAKKLFDDAERLSKSGNKQDLEIAAEKLRQAEELWPTLPGFEDRNLKIRQKYPILRVGVRQLPKHLSPHTALTDSELRAVEMLFESLVKFSPDVSGAGHYHPDLAEGRPLVVELGRQFQLPANAYWCNPQKVGDGLSTPPLPDSKDAVTFNDIRATFHALQSGDGPDHSLVWENLYGEKVVTGGGSGLRATVHLNKGYIEPLALMNAKIVPAWALAQGQQENFGLNPVGSGPFVYAGSGSEQGRTFARFLANPYYGTRAGKLNWPRFREVRFFAYTDAEQEIKNKLEVLLDLTAEEADTLHQTPSAGYNVHLPVATTPNHRVYYLAVNHRVPPLNDENARSALSMAINREKILDDSFRGKLKRKVHKAINSPYPANCWATDPKLHNLTDPKSCDPCDPSLAKANWSAAKKKLRPGEEVTLSLKYPDGDAALAKAMSALANQVQEILKIQIRPVPVDVHALQRDLETSNFDLAYCHYDFPDDTFWLGPLFAAKKPADNGANLENILGYDSAVLRTQMQMAIDYREFAKVQEHTRVIHKILMRETPVIPLWQLDPLHALRKEVKTPPFDPQPVFTDIEKWQLGEVGQ
jgi:ABC-type transport system substrate-binding protein